MQQCTFKRNFRKNVDSEKFAQEALMAKTDNKKQEGKFKPSNKNLKKEDQCNYCKKKGHWGTRLQEVDS